ncbi:MAG TPA: hypothetical protein VMT60_02595, partial [Candidatus Bathyarchaeia archaeon]|nr:hypothetical protein [Candidatus Bathyarchaeia archaeon]
MMKKIVAVLAAFAILFLGHAPASSFPLGVSVVGGIGAGYYAMDDLNRHLGLVAQSRNVRLDGITGGVNVRVEGRLWVLNQVALTAGYEHFWGASDAEDTSVSLSYRAPADVYTFGAVVVVLRVENVVNLCVGVNGCFAQTVYGTNEVVLRRLSEFKGQNGGYEAFAEAHTNFIDPIEVGFQLGYRGLRIDSFKDKFGRE